MNVLRRNPERDVRTHESKDILDDSRAQAEFFLKFFDAVPGAGGLERFSSRFGMNTLSLVFAAGFLISPAMRGKRIF